MAQPPVSHSVFHIPPQPPRSAPIPPPSLSSSSDHTYLMTASPRRNGSQESYKPKIITTVGARPACLVNASVTYVGEDLIYAFGGFDQYTDEVYNHVLKLDLKTRQWSLVDNYGDIPGVRMGHTANLWQGSKLLVYGGENEHRAYLSDVIIFDLNTAQWTQPELKGPAPRGRARHSAVIHDEKLWITGGMTGQDSYVLDDICYLDLKTWTWSRTWRFVPRYDHTTWIWGGRVWLFGGLNDDMERSSELFWLDLRGSYAFDSQYSGQSDRQLSVSRYSRFGGSTQPQQPVTGSTGHTANSGSVAVQPNSLATRNPPVAPGSISSLKFVASPDLPPQAQGRHFHVYSSGYLLDFMTPASVISSGDSVTLCGFDLETMRWQKLAEGKDLFHPDYRWHYCTMNDDGTHAWLLGCPTQDRNGAATTEEYLSDVLPIDLCKLGLLGNALSLETRSDRSGMPSSDSHMPSHLSGIGADLSRTFDQDPATGSGADFVVTGELDDPSGDETMEDPVTSPPIHVHRLILQARWPHFSRLYNAQMLEFHTKKLHLPEPYTAVRAFLYYLYTDSIAPHPTAGPSIADVAGMLVMANIYDMPRLQVLCRNRLIKELDIENAALIWERASTAGEDELKRRAAAFAMTYWGRVVRTRGFKNLSQQALVELCEEVDLDGRVLGREELEAVGGLGGARLGVASSSSREGRKRARESVGVAGADEDEAEEVEDDGMDVV